MRDYAPDRFLFVGRNPQACASMSAEAREGTCAPAKDKGSTLRFICPPEAGKPPEDFYASGRLGEEPFFEMGF